MSVLVPAGTKGLESPMPGVTRSYKPPMKKEESNTLLL